MAILEKEVKDPAPGRFSGGRAFEGSRHRLAGGGPVAAFRGDRAATDRRANLCRARPRKRVDRDEPDNGGRRHRPGRRRSARPAQFFYTHLSYFDLHPDTLLHIEAVDDFRAAKQQGKLGIIFGVQGIASKLNGDVSLLRILHKIGLRVAQLTHNDHTNLGAGCLEPDDRGLTQLGRAAVAEMNQIGITVDIAHAGERTARDAIAFSTRPIINSHANARAITENPRNLSDALLKDLAEKGGLIGITAYSPFVGRSRDVRPGLDDMVDHIVHVADTIGIDHVGIGTDLFEAESEVRYKMNAYRFAAMRRGVAFADRYIEGFTQVDHFPSLTDTLVRRGFSDPEIHKILGDNILRVFTATWKR